MLSIFEFEFWIWISETARETCAEQSRIKSQRVGSRSACLSCMRLCAIHIRVSRQIKRMKKNYTMHACIVWMIVVHNACLHVVHGVIDNVVQCRTKCRTMSYTMSTSQLSSLGPCWVFPVSKNVQKLLVIIFRTEDCSVWCIICSKLCSTMFEIV